MLKIKKKIIFQNFDETSIPKDASVFNSKTFEEWFDITGKKEILVKGTEKKK